MDDKKPYSSNREGELDYASQLEKIAHTGDIRYDTFVKNIADALRQIYGADPYSNKALSKLKEKVNAFMQEHAGMSYEEFSRKSRPEDFDSNDYGKIPKPTLKRRLFEYRSKLYIAALADSEKQGYDLEEMLDFLESSKIPYIKKEKAEPTYSRLLEVLHKHKQ